MSSPEVCCPYPSISTIPLADIRAVPVGGYLTLNSFGFVQVLDRVAEGYWSIRRSRWVITAHPGRGWAVRLLRNGASPGPGARTTRLDGYYAHLRKAIKRALGLAGVHEDKAMLKAMLKAARNHLRYLGEAAGNGIDWYYGSSVAVEDQILSEGLRSQRTSGGIYLASRRKAEVYASAWGVGLNALGLGEPEGVVYSVSLPEEEIPKQRTQVGEIRLDLDRIPGDRLRVIHRIDLADLTETQKAGHMYNFLGIVGRDPFGPDSDSAPYPSESRWEGLADRVRSIIQAIPGEVLLMGMAVVPAV